MSTGIRWNAATSEASPSGQHASKVLLNIVATRLSPCSSERVYPPRGAERFPPVALAARYAVGGPAIPRAGKEEEGTAVFACFIAYTKAYDSVDWELLWDVPRRFVVPPRMLAAIRNFHDGMRARVRSGIFSEWSDVQSSPL